MDIQETKKEGIFILSLKGRLDAITAPAFREKMTALGRQDEPWVLLDFSAVDYVSSAGLRVLFEAAFSFQDQAKRLGGYAVTADVRKIFDLADLPSELPLFASQEEAMKKGR